MWEYLTTVGFNLWHMREVDTIYNTAWLTKIQRIDSPETEWTFNHNRSNKQRNTRERKKRNESRSQAVVALWKATRWKAVPQLWKATCWKAVPLTAGAFAFT